MKSPNRFSSHKISGVRVQKPIVGRDEDERLWREVRKYAQMIPLEPEPNLGRVREIKEELKKGSYPTREMIQETAAHFAIRFMTRE